jgi:hypothetical protein
MEFESNLIYGSLVMIKFLNKYILIKLNLNIFHTYLLRAYGDWGLGIGDWGLGIGDWAQSPIPNPQSPIPIISFSLIKFFNIFKNKNNYNLIIKKYYYCKISEYLSS